MAAAPVYLPLGAAASLVRAARPPGPGPQIGPGTTGARTVPDLHI